MLLGRNNYRYLDMMLSYIKYAPLMASIRILWFIIDTILFSVNIFIPAMFIDAAIKIANGEAMLSTVILPIFLILLNEIYSRFKGIITTLIECRTNNKLNYVIDPLILKKRASIKYRYYENQETMDVMSRAINNFRQNLSGMFNQVIWTFQIIANFISLIIILGTRMWWSAILLFVISIPVMIVAYKGGKKLYDTDKKLTKTNRKAGYFIEIMTSRENIEERYNFGFTDRMINTYKENYEFARTLRKKVERRRWIDIKFISVTIVLSSIIIISSMFPAVVGGFISIGMFTSLCGAIIGLENMFSWQLSNVITNFKYQLEYLKDLNAFLKYEENDDFVCMPQLDPYIFKEIEFKNITFKYPGTDKYILSDFNLKLEAGKHYAIVGVNGAGKSTLAKLLTGLYDEYEGEILIDGKELRSLSQCELKSLIGIVFQNFSHYPLDLQDNIAIGNVNSIMDNNEVENAVSTINLSDVVDRLPYKYNTPITKVKDNGVDLSGGEWQRVALARLMVNPSPLKILDEPTAALDPIAESCIYEQFNQITKRTNASCELIIFISHRLGSTRLADNIIVINNGKVAEKGTFDELIEKQDVFAEMWNMQSEWYRNTNEEVSQVV